MSKKKKQRFPGLQRSSVSELYWDLFSLETQMRFVIQNHLLVSFHPQDTVKVNTLNAILNKTGFSKKPLLPSNGEPF